MPLQYKIKSDKQLGSHFVEFWSETKVKEMFTSQNWRQEMDQLMTCAFPFWYSALEQAKMLEDSQPDAGLDRREWVYFQIWFTC